MQASAQSIRPLLMRIGLDAKETEVYLALLSLKMARAVQISKVAKQSRSHTYLILRSLLEKGLVSEVTRGKVIHFVAEPPERLVSYLQNREQEARELQTLVQGTLPFLSSLTKPLSGEPRVTILYGLEGAKQVYRDVLTREFCALFNPEGMYRQFGSNIVTDLYGKNPQMHGRDLLVDNKSSRKYIAEVPQHERYHISLLPKEVQFESDTIIFEEEIAMFTFGDPVTIIRIENADLADTLRSWHTALWGVSTEV